MKRDYKLYLNDMSEMLIDIRISEHPKNSIQIKKFLI